MKLIFPDQIKFRGERIGEDKWNFSYLERFNEPNQEAMETTKKLLTTISKNFFGGKLKIRMFKNTLSISQQGTSEDMYDFLVSEFLPQSKMGKRTLGELFASIGVMAGIAKPPEQVASEFLPQPGATGELHKENSKEVS